MQYHEQIKHPLWQKKRLEVLEMHRFECENCGSDDKELHIHHPFYKRGAMIWDYNSDDLMCLCHKCHRDSHSKDEEIRLLISDRNICKDILIGILKAMNDSPFTQLNSYEEIMGYLNYYGILGELRDKLIDEIIDHGGKPYEYILESQFNTSYTDIAAACFDQSKDIQDVFKAAEKETKRRIQSYRKQGA